ncbi:MAG TPA: tetratricopeptide repeat protein [Lacipirellulaceae bacterium]|nr:tetratricopeptide repeat protein [Lacipirellulaceae bacterium]
MDVTLSGRMARFGGALVAAALSCGQAGADDASTMMFVTATDAIARDASAPSPARGEPSDLVVHIADDQAASSGLAAARGDLTVIASAEVAGAAQRVIQDGEVVPAAHAGGALAWMGAGARRPSMASGIQSERSARRQGHEAALAQSTLVHEAPPAYGPQAPAASREAVRYRAATPTAPKLKTPGDHAKELLVRAYQLSLTATTEAEYSQIVQWCATATRVELDAETKAFSHNLSAWALNRRGQARADQGESELALADFRAAIEFAPANDRALHNRAVTLAQDGQFAEAFDDLCRVIQINPQFAKAYSNRATLYVQAGDYERALADYDAAIAADPQLLPALVGRGRVCHMQGKLEEALESLNAAVRLEPTDAEIVCSRADLLADLGRYEDALLDYAQAIDLNGKFEHAYRNGAWLLATCPVDEIRDVEGALAGAQAALDCGYGERHSALDTMAAALANAGRYEEAVGTIQQAIDVAPEEARAAYLARQQLYELRQPFRTHPVGAAAHGVAMTTGAEQPEPEPTTPDQAAVYIEE